MTFWTGPGRRVYVAVCLLLALSFAAETQAREVFVDATRGDNSSGDGSARWPWKTVSFALTQAAQPGDIIHIAPGLYDAALGEQPNLLLPAGVSLVGVDREITRIESLIEVRSPAQPPRMEKITVIGLDVQCHAIEASMTINDCLIDLDRDWARFDVTGGGEFHPQVRDSRFQGRNIYIVTISASDGSVFGGDWRDGFFYLGLDGAHIVSVDLSAGSRMTTLFVGNVFEAKLHEGLAFWMVLELSTTQR